MSLPELPFESDLESDLRRVVVPDGLLERLRAVALADDADLDDLLRSVPLPEGLMQRLYRTPLADDAGIDAALRGLPVPGSVMWRLNRIPRHRSAWERLVRWAAAASLWLAVGLAYAGGVVLLLLSAYAPSLRQPARGVALVLSAEEREAGEQSGLVDLATDAIALQEPRGERGRGPVEVPGGLPPIDILAADRMAAQRSDMFLPEGVGRPFDPLEEAARYRWPQGTTVWGSPGIDALPELKKVAGPLPRGIDPPLVPGFPLGFFIRHRVHPFVPPAAHPLLQSSVVPLGISPASYELTQRYLEDGELPAAELIRTEEFLAAADYGFPAPRGKPLELWVGAGPSPFGGEGLTLMQVGIQARGPAGAKRPPVHLILAADTSASMRWGGRLDMVRRALERMARYLGPEDRLSLVAFSNEAWAVIEDVSLNDWEQWLEAVAWLRAEEGTNLAAGLREAYAAAARLAQDHGALVRVVLLTDGTAVLDQGTAGQIEQRLAECAGQGRLLEVIDLGQESQPDRLLLSLAAVGGGRVRRAVSADQIGWALAEILSGQAQQVAADVRLSVTFNPQTVMAWRLLGHEPSAITGLIPAEPECDFYAGQSATALYELRLRPSGGELVAVVELQWHSPGGETQRTIVRRVRKSDFALSFAQSPPPLQQAALYAQTAELLRRSPFARLPGGSPVLALRAIRQLAEQMDTQVRERPAFVEFLRLLDEASRAEGLWSRKGSSPAG